MAGGIKLKINGTELKALALAYYNVINTWSVDGEVDMLVMHHTVSFRKMLLKKLLNESEKSIKLSDTETLAFYLQWMQVDLMNPVFTLHERLIVQLILDEADNRIQQLKIQKLRPIDDETEETEYNPVE